MQCVKLCNGLCVIHTLLLLYNIYKLCEFLNKRKKKVKNFIYYTIDVVLTTFLTISINRHFVIKLIEILAFLKH